MGRAVGGTTVVNSGTCFRTPDAVLATWAASGIRGVGPEAMAPWFEAVEEVLGVQPVPEEVLGSNGEVMRRGAEQLGLSGGPIRRNIRGCHGHGVCAFGCPVDAKQAMHLSYLPRATAAGARVFSGARVRKIRLQAGRAAGVVADVLDQTGRRRGTLHVDARATVLAAGAIFTPVLLARQHLARSSRSSGATWSSTPGLGRLPGSTNPSGRGAGRCRATTSMRSFPTVSCSRRPSRRRVSAIRAGSLPGWGRDKSLFALYPHMASCGSIIGDAGVGRVGPLGRNGVFIRYNLTRGDAAKVLEGIAMAAEIYFAAGGGRGLPDAAGAWLHPLRG